MSTFPINGPWENEQCEHGQARCDLVATASECDKGPDSGASQTLYELPISS